MEFAADLGVVVVEMLGEEDVVLLAGGQGDHEVVLRARGLEAEALGLLLRRDFPGSAFRRPLPGGRGIFSLLAHGA